MIAFTFPGQGSQKPGMGERLARPPVVGAGRPRPRAVAGRDVAPPAARRRRRRAQGHPQRPALDLRRQPGGARRGRAPRRRAGRSCAGHSLGEYTALVASGALAFDDGVRLVAERGDAMQAAATERAGTMAAVLGLDDDEVEVACARRRRRRLGGQLQRPRPGRHRRSTRGRRRGRGRVAKELGRQAGRCRWRSAAPSTRPFMAPARDRLRKAHRRRRAARRPTCPSYANVDARAHTGADEWAGLLGAQLCSPVRWRQTPRPPGRAPASPPSSSSAPAPC